MRIKLYRLFIALVFFTGALPVLSQTTSLSIALAGNQVVLFWPVTFTNWVLQGTPSLSPAAWSTNLPAPIVVNGQKKVTVPISGKQQFYELTLIVTVPAGMALIPAGAFTMGDTLDAESDAIPTNINVSAFYMGTNLVTYGQWQPVYSEATNSGYVFNFTGAGQATNYPVEAVNWDDCVKWCNARSVQAGLTPCYYTNAGMTQVFKFGENGTPVYVNWSANGYRLPTEAEWEKAARGGLIGLRFPWGNNISESLANYYAEPSSYSYDLAPYNGFNTTFDTGDTPYTSPVGYFEKNEYGLFDMAGNLDEWCWDWYGTPYGQPTNTNPTGPASGTYRVARGGSWTDLAYYARCAGRIYGFYPANAYSSVGFRCVRGL